MRMPARNQGAFRIDGAGLNSADDIATHMHVVMVHSPTAGDSTHDRDWLVHTAQMYGHSVEYFESGDQGWRSARVDADLIAVAGGDGSVGEVARSIAGGSDLMTIIPLG